MLRKVVGQSQGRLLIGLGGGDGTVHLAANALLLAEPLINLRQIVLLPLWGGNANDFAYMLNGLASRARLKSIFGKANIVPIHPLEIASADASGKKMVRYAVCYASFGVSAYTADQLAKPLPEGGFFSKLARSGMLNEFRRAVSAMMDAPGFDVEQDGRKVKMYEQLFSNGSRFAKVDRLPVMLTGKQFYYTVRSDTRPRVSFYLLRLVGGKKLGQVRQKPVRFTTRERAWAQFDGEATVIAEHTAIRVGHSKQALYALSTKLNTKPNSR